MNGEHVNDVAAHAPTPQPSRSGPARRRTWLAGSSALAVLALLAVVSLHSGSQQAPPAAGAAPADAAAGSIAAAGVGAGRRAPCDPDPLGLGVLPAPVLVAEWGDFQCPFCRPYDQDTQTALIRQYVATGQVR